MFGSFEWRQMPDLLWFILSYFVRQAFLSLIMGFSSWVLLVHSFEYFAKQLVNSFELVIFSLAFSVKRIFSTS